LAYLLDTNHCSHAIRRDPVIVARLAAIADQEIGSCVVVEAELLFMAYNSDRMADNLADVRRFLGAMRLYGVDSYVSDVYAQLKARLFARFGPRERAKRRHTTIQQIGFSDNDLWIAAIAMRFGLTLVSADRDFARVGEVAALAWESWLPAASPSESRSGSA
jgi:tRNA(fMet)-specific endonuclease VapC